MQTILAVLLYLNLISPNSTYNLSYIDSLDDLYSSQIEIIVNDPLQMETVNDFDTPEVPSITIVIDTGG